MRFTFISVLILLITIFSISQAVPTMRSSTRSTNTVAQQNELNAKTKNANAIKGDQNVVNQLGIATNLDVSPVVSVPIDLGSK